MPPGRAKGGKRRSRGRFRSYRGKRRANQADAHDPTDPSYYGKGKGKGKDKGGKGKGKGKDDKGKSFKGTTGKGTPGAFEATTSLGWDEWHEDSYCADPGWNYAAYDEQQSYTYYSYASKAKTRRIKKRRSRKVKR